MLPAPESDTTLEREALEEDGSYPTPSDHTSLPNDSTAGGLVEGTSLASCLEGGAFSPPGDVERQLVHRTDHDLLTHDPGTTKPPAMTIHDGPECDVSPPDLSGSQSEPRSLALVPVDVPLSGQFETAQRETNDSNTVEETMSTRQNSTSAHEAVRDSIPLNATWSQSEAPPPQSDGEPLAVSRSQQQSARGEEEGESDTVFPCPPPEVVSIPVDTPR